jgi:hypothetical protein
MAKWSVDQIYSYTRFLLNKNQAGGISATDLFNAWNGEQSAYHEDLIGRWQARSNGKSGPNTGMIQDETVLIKMAPFMIPITLPINSGFVNWPSDFIYLQALRINGEKVYHFNKDERWSIERSYIDPPSIVDDSYYYTEYDGKYLILPTAATSIDMDYIAQATDILWAFNFDGNGRQVYDAGNSIQPSWSQNTIVEITRRTLNSFGVHFSSQYYAEFGKSNIITGD